MLSLSNNVALWMVKKKIPTIFKIRNAKHSRKKNLEKVKTTVKEQ